MQIAHRADLVHGHASGHKLLFHGGDLGGVGPAHNVFQLRLDCRRLRAAVQGFNDFFQFANFFSTIFHRLAPYLIESHVNI